MSDVQFSVVIPTYHRNDLLARCLLRIAPGMQTLDASRYEVIVTDDGRAGSAEAMIREQFPWARWIKGPQKGPAANRNHGAKQVRGEWVVFLDDDVVAKPDWLAAYAAAVRDDVDVYEGKTVCEAGCHPGIEESPINLVGGNLWSCNMMIRRSRFEAMGGFDEDFPFPHMEDIDFHMRAQNLKVPEMFVRSAVVDHPPRLKRFGFAAGRTWESRVFYVFKHQQRKGVLFWLPTHVLKQRVRELLQLGLRREVFYAARSLMLEWLYVVFHVYRWQQRYRGRTQ